MEPFLIFRKGKLEGKPLRYRRDLGLYLLLGMYPCELFVRNIATEVWKDDGEDWGWIWHS